MSNFDSKTAETLKNVLMAACTLLVVILKVREKK
jgi:hypothetical protein